MKRYWGKQIAPPGIYLKAGELGFKSMMHEGPLPGSEEDAYRRVPALALLFIGPILGGAFVIFLPVIGFALLMGVVLGKIIEVGAHAVEAVIRVFKPTYQLGWAFLSRAKPSDDATKHRDAWLEEAEKELRSKEDESEPGPRP
jgi:hypothetical protein